MQVGEHLRPCRRNHGRQRKDDHNILDKNFHNGRSAFGNNNTLTSKRKPCRVFALIGGVLISIMIFRDYDYEQDYD
jgi:hypothetical protein